MVFRYTLSELVQRFLEKKVAANKATEARTRGASNGQGEGQLSQQEIGYIAGELDEDTGRLEGEVAIEEEGLMRRADEIWDNGRQEVTVGVLITGCRSGTQPNHRMPCERRDQSTRAVLWCGER